MVDELNISKQSFVMAEIENTSKIHFDFLGSTVKVPERVQFRHENVHLSANHSSSWKQSWAVIG